MSLRRSLASLLDLAGPRNALRLVGLSLLCALAEGFGFVLLVPLLAHLGGEPIALPFDLTLPDMPIEALLIAFVALVAIRAVAELARQLTAQDVQASVVDGLRLRATDALLAARWHWLSRHGRASIEALLIGTMDRAGYAAELLAGLVRLALALFALGVAALAISPSASLTIGAAGILLLLALLPFMGRARRMGKALSRANDKLYASLGEMLASLRIIKSFGREARATDTVSRSLAELRQRERAFVRDTALAQGGLQIAGAALAALLAWFALDALDLPLAILLPLAAVFVRALPLVGQLLSSAQGWSHAHPAIAEALQLIEDATERVEPDAASNAPRLTSDLVLHDIHVAHEADRLALTGASVTIEARQLVVLTGPSGSGKSTLADVAAGLLVPDSGTLAIDGTPLDELGQRAWRSRVAYVPQDPVLFGGTVRDNLLWAVPKATEQQIVSAIEDAAATFVHTLPGGLDCELGESARALSGGERQRIALARALLRDPDLIVLDEATSAVDAGSEQAIASALHALTRRITVLAIAHRGILPEIADRVVRLDRGHIVSD